MTRNSAAIPGWRVGGSVPSVGMEPKSLAPRQDVPYYCSRGHETTVPLAAGVEAPPERDCPRCGLPAGLDKDNPPEPPAPERYRTHLGYVKERRSEKDADQILAEAWARVRASGVAR